MAYILYALHSPLLAVVSKKSYCPTKPKGQSKRSVGRLRPPTACPFVGQLHLFLSVSRSVCPFFRSSTVCPFVPLSRKKSNYVIMNDGFSMKAENLFLYEIKKCVLSMLYVL